ncbi:MAG TPA: Lrp/AsnC family transcriptional regulator [Parvularculaceae bacterium]|nr:Lrp/AsnC family transcriptional regulator [Parvularculaceae bacterium]
MPKYRVDEIDAEILRALQADARLTNLELAARVGLSPTPCLRRVRQLQAEGLIEGFRAILDRRQTGLGLTTFLFVDIEQHSDEAVFGEFRRAVAEFPEVVAGHVIAGEHDYLIEVVCEDLEAYRNFFYEKLLRLPKVRNVQSMFVIESFKIAAPLPLDHMAKPKSGRKAVS